LGDKEKVLGSKGLSEERRGGGGGGTGLLSRTSERKKGAAAVVERKVGGFWTETGWGNRLGGEWYARKPSLESLKERKEASSEEKKGNSPINMEEGEKGGE